MLKNSFALSAFIVIMFTNCQKEAISKTDMAETNLSEKKSAPESLASKSLVSDEHWYGNYDNSKYILPRENGEPGGDADHPDVEDVFLIKNGVAVLPSLGDYTFNSYVFFNIPPQYNISGDSLVFEAVVMNSKDNSFYDYDVALQITGEQYSAEVHFVADTAEQKNNKYYVGNAKRNNVPALVNYFGDFKTIKLGLKSDQTGVYVNGKLIYHFKYGADNRIGRVRTITVLGSGFVTVNSIKLSNSYTNKKIMTENFNYEGQSHTVFY